MSVGILFFFSGQAPEAAASTSCPPGYSSNAGSCYKLMDFGATAPDAHFICQGEGASLVSIDDAAENDFVYFLFG